MDVGAIIEQARSRAELSQRDLADRAGTSGPAICFYENGDRMPRVDTLARIVAATGAQLTVAVEFDGSLVDPVDNARRLEDVLDLADALPQRHEPELRYPVLRRLTS